MKFPFIVTRKKPPYFPLSLPSDEYGVVAIGGELNDQILKEAYSKGYFPWYESPPVVWHSPRLRTLLLPEEFKTNRRFLRWVKNTSFHISCDTRFDEVVTGCATVRRPGQRGTWIHSDMYRAYLNFHRTGYAHSVEVSDENGSLVGGLYGVSLGKCFFGESMFSTQPNTSKLALYYLVQYSLKRHFSFIDCQVPTDHLKRLGAREFPKKRFETMLYRSLASPFPPGSWREDFEDFKATWETL